MQFDFEQGTTVSFKLIFSMHSKGEHGLNSLMQMSRIGLVKYTKQSEHCMVFQRGTIQCSSEALLLKNPVCSAYVTFW